MPKSNPNDLFGGLRKDLSSVARSLIKIGASKSELRQASEKSAEVLAGAIRVKMMETKRTGALMNTIRISKLTSGVSVKIGNRKVPYAAPINFGWLVVGPGHQKMESSKRIKTGKPNILPARFMEKGIRNSRERSINIWIEELHKLIEKYERK